MQIARHTVVTFDYTLTDDAGEIIDSSEGGAPLAYIQGLGQLVPGLETALEGRTAGDAFKVSLPPEQGYGLRDEAEMHEVPLSLFDRPEDLEVGIRVEAHGPQGTQLLTVAAVDGDTVILDGNHPLAGITLHFDVQVRAVRAATEEEIDHGHVHGEHTH